MSSGPPTEETAAFDKEEGYFLEVEKTDSEKDSSIQSTRTTTENSLDSILIDVQQGRQPQLSPSSLDARDDESPAARSKPAKLSPQSEGLLRDAVSEIGSPRRVGPKRSAHRRQEGGVGFSRVIRGLCLNHQIQLATDPKLK